MAVVGVQPGRTPLGSVLVAMVPPVVITTMRPASGCAFAGETAGPTSSPADTQATAAERTVFFVWA
jgi:hypothetical protein